MNATIAVAAITAGSTLAAAGLTGYITLVLHKRQVTAERSRVREESRRSAYADLLSASTTAWEALDGIWGLRPPTQLGEPSPPEVENTAQSLKQLDHALHLACLHGPPEIVRPASALYFKAVEEFQELVSMLLDNMGDSRTLRQIHPRRAPDRSARLLLRSEFIGKAMRASGGDQV
ncbi:hypothetical protein [Streptomyces sp. NPDC014805]|uniref:hypothetical protein n=1 Tax=Streptomyces sp. NPDC014805 TaxID=3364919 RepID=UPI0036FE67C6